jgi:malonyl-CoA O-methyltransferase
LQCCPAQAVYVGWSLGGQLAIELALREPDRVAGVITLCSNPCFVARDDWPGMSQQAFDAFRAGVAADPIAALQRFDSLQVAGASAPRELLRRLRRLGRVPDASDLSVGLEWLRLLDLRRSLAALTQPQLHVLASQDALVPANVGNYISTAIATVAAGQVRTLADTCHLAPLDAPVQVAAEIRAFTAGWCETKLSPGRPAEREKAAVAESFSRAAPLYDSAARLQRDVGAQLLQTLDDWQRAPSRVLDLGCGTGHFCPALQARFPGADYVGLDLAPGMVQYARAHCADAGLWLVGDAESLPLASASVDLVFSSLAMQWCTRPEHLFAELSRVLAPGGMCVFTSLGDQTLHELRAAWAAVDAHQHVNSFIPVAELAAVTAGIPGLTARFETRILKMEYARVRDLLDELKTLGAHNVNRARRSGLTSRRALQGMLQAYESWRSEGVLPATYEVIYGILEKA